MKAASPCAPVTRRSSRALRNLALTALRLAGITNITTSLHPMPATLRRHATVKIT
jgi:hypothetical protein